MQLYTDKIKQNPIKVKRRWRSKYEKLILDYFSGIVYMTPLIISDPILLYTLYTLHVGTNKCICVCLLLNDLSHI